MVSSTATCGSDHLAARGRDRPQTPPAAADRSICGSALPFMPNQCWRRPRRAKPRAGQLRLQRRPPPRGDLVASACSYQEWLDAECRVQVRGGCKASAPTRGCACASRATWPRAARRPSRGSGPRRCGRSVGGQIGVSDDHDLQPPLRTSSDRERGRRAGRRGPTPRTNPVADGDPTVVPLRHDDAGTGGIAAAGEGSPSGSRGAAHPYVAAGTGPRRGADEVDRAFCPAARLITSPADSRWTRRRRRAAVESECGGREQTSAANHGVTSSTRDPRCSAGRRHPTTIVDPKSRRERAAGVRSVAPRARLRRTEAAGSRDPALMSSPDELSRPACRSGLRWRRRRPGSR